MLFRLGYAQQNTSTSISVNFQQAGVDQFVTELEAKTGYHFYYNPAQFDSLKVTVQLNNKPIETVLAAAFKNTDFHYTISNRNIFFTRGREIQPKLAAGFFGNKPQATPQTN